MIQVEVVIVALTHMHEGRCCVGGLQVERDTNNQIVPVRNWRLLRHDGMFPLLTDTLFRVGEIWRVTLTPSPAHKLKPPHLEDARVFQAERVGYLSDPLATNLYQLLQRNPSIPFVRGSETQLFEGKLHQEGGPTGSWSRYISPEDAPTHSTSFWMPDFKLFVEEQFGKLRVFNRERRLGMRYVAVEPR
ncbi:MAG: hypothetical protein ACK4UU_00050, partial [Fimbriimonadales bacterium]